MNLLQKPEDRGYPIEYLLSRIRGRRSRLISDWKALVLESSPLDLLTTARYLRGAPDASPEGIWRRLVIEFGWVYRQMNEALREMFRPFFLYTELRTLFICLRRIKTGAAGRTDGLLDASLLSDGLKAMLKAGADVSAAIKGIEKAFVSLSGEFKGLSETYEIGGLRGFEQRMTNAYLVHTVRSGPHPLLKTLFIRIIDARNIIGLYKAVRLNVRIKPVYIAGGSIAEDDFKGIISRDDIFGINDLVRKATGTRIDAPDVSKVEGALYKGISRLLRKEGRDPLGAGLVLDYLWRCSVEAMNLSVLFHARDLERESVAAELVY